MKGFEFARRAFLFLCVLGMAWSVWAANTAANATAAAPSDTSANATAQLFSKFASFTLGLDDVPLLNQHTFMGVALWQWALGAIYVALAYLFSWLVDYIFRHWLRRLARRTQTTHDDLILDAIKGPVRVLVFVLLHNVGLNVLELPPWVETWLSRAFMLVSGGALAFIGWRAINLYFAALISRAKPEEIELREQLYPLMRKAVKAALALITALLVTHNMGLNITSLIASLSIGGLALGLAAQDTLANLFGAVSVLLDKPFRVGEVVRLGDVEGLVERIGLRSTSIRSADGHLVSVPNKTVGNATIINISGMPARRTLFDLQLPHDIPTEKLRRAMTLLEEIFRTDKDTKEFWLAFSHFAPSALILHVRHWSRHTLDQKAHLMQMNGLHFAIKERFAAEGIEFASPSQTLYVKNAADAQPFLSSDKA